MSNKIAIGFVGDGFGRYGLMPAFRRDQRCHLVAVCTGSKETAAKISSDQKIPYAFSDFSEMLAQVPMNAIAIATPPRVQEVIARAALDAGVAVFAEKPLACNLTAAKTLLAHAEASAVANAVDFMFPELETWRRARDLLQTGAVGRVRHAMLDWRTESYDNARRRSFWKADPEFGGGALSHFGSHAFHNLEWFLGPITRLVGQLSVAPDLSVPGDTLATIAVTFRSGATGSLSISTAALHGSGHRIEIYGESGTLVLANDTLDPILGFQFSYGARDGIGLEIIAKEAPDQLEIGEDHRVAPVSRLVQRFIDAVSGGPPVRPSFADGVRAQVLIDAVRESNTTGAWIDTDYVGRDY